MDRPMFPRPTNPTWCHKVQVGGSIMHRTSYVRRSKQGSAITVHNHKLCGARHSHGQAVPPAKTCLRRWQGAACRGLVHAIAGPGHSPMHTTWTDNAEGAVHCLPTGHTSLSPPIPLHFTSRYPYPIHTHSCNAAGTGAHHACSARCSPSQRQRWWWSTSDESTATAGLVDGATQMNRPTRQHEHAKGTHKRTLHSEACGQNRLQTHTMEGKL